MPSVPSIAKSGSLDSELSVSPKRNSISRTHKDKGPFHILSSTSQTNKVPEGQSQTPVPASASTRLFGLAKPKEKKEKKKKNKGSRSQPCGELPTPGPLQPHCPQILKGGQVSVAWGWLNWGHSGVCCLARRTCFACEGCWDSHLEYQLCGHLRHPPPLCTRVPRRVCRSHIPGICFPTEAPR